MRISLLESYYGGSHKSWADGYQRFSNHRVELLTMPAQFWKWRMQGAAISFARLLDFTPDVILASSMIDLSIFRALTFRQLGSIPAAMYFHENQLSYPQNRRQDHGFRYGFINYVSALTADENYFNSAFHLQDFMQQLPRLLKHFGDYNEMQTIERIRAKSQVLPLGIDLRRFDAHKNGQRAKDLPLILWNHRWEDDKDPETFVRSMMQLVSAGYDFRVAISGESFGQMPAAFDMAKHELGDRLIQLGYLESFAEYARLLWQADYVVSTAWQEFFGVSICEAIYCGCIPILPNRLNYPHLLSDDVQSACLYRQGKLTALLRHHLDGNIRVSGAALREKIAQLDWRLMARRYDEEFERLLNRHRHAASDR